MIGTAALFRHDLFLESDDFFQRLGLSFSKCQSHGSIQRLFVITLGGLTAFRGAALLLSSGGPISGFSPDYTWWGQGRIGPVPVPVIIFLTCAVAAHLVLRYFQFGRHVYASGGNSRAAALNGVPTRKILFQVYVIVGFFCGLAGFLLSARLNSAEAVAGIGTELTVIAAVVIGGTSLFGGVGSILEPW